MFYDGSRSKWLSVETFMLTFGRNGTTASASYFRGVDSLVYSSTRGHRANNNGTVVALQYTRSDSDSVPLEVTADGNTVASVTSAAVAGGSNTLNGNFSAGAVLGARVGSSGGNAADNVIGHVLCRWRA